MSNVPTSSLPTWTDGTDVYATNMDQLQQVLQSAINDNYSQILKIQSGQQSLVIYVGANYPSAPGQGTLCYRTDLKLLQVYDGTTWQNSVNGDTAATANTFVLRDANGATNLSKLNGYATDTKATASTIAVRDGNGVETSTAFAPAGLAGAVAASRYAGATASGAPVSGTFAVGDIVVDQTGAFWICTTAGTPGTWTKIPGMGSFSNQLQGNGYQKLPSGLIIQWGTFSNTGNVNGTTVPFPIQFPNALLGLTVTPVDSSLGTTTAEAWVTGSNVSNFYLRSSGNFNSSWIAVGY